MPDDKPNQANDEPLAADEQPEEKETYDLLISEEPREKREAEEVDIEAELAPEEIYDTQHSDGHTYDPRQAEEQGLTYTPPTDPPVLPSDDPQGAEVAAGFAQSMEESEAGAEAVPPAVSGNDLDLQEKVYRVLGHNSETGHLTNIKVQVHNGLVRLLGSVPGQADLTLAHEIVSEIDDVGAIENNLQVIE